MIIKEEMTAQAEQMKAMVNELIALVEGGSGLKNAGGTKKMAPAVRSVKKPEHRRKASSGQAGKVVNPAQLIPFGDDDFQDF
jgi:hypothetical protein